MRKNLRMLLAIALVLVATTLPTLAYDDIKFAYTVASPKDWLVVKVIPDVPGVYRFGWVSPTSNKDQSGANVLSFVQLLDSDVAVPELLAKNVEAAQANGLKVVKQQVVNQGGFQGFVMETTGMGNGYSLQWKMPMASPSPNTKTRMDSIPTRQRFFALVKGKKVVALMSTCSERSYSAYAPVFAKIEKTLVLK